MKRLYFKGYSFDLQSPPRDPYLQEFVTKNLSLESIIWAAQTYLHSEDGVILDIGSNIGVTGIDTLDEFVQLCHDHFLFHYKTIFLRSGE